MDRLPEVESVVGNVIPVTWMHIVRQPLTESMYKAFTIGFERALDDYAHSGKVFSRAAAVQKWYNTGANPLKFLTAAKGKRTVKMVVYKEPAFAHAPEFVVDSVPGAPIIYILRDGRDVANSLVSSYNEQSDKSLARDNSILSLFGRKYDHRYVPWWVDEGDDKRFIEASQFGRSIWMWRVMVDKCDNYFKSLPEDTRKNILIVKYEDLMHNPLERGREILDHIGCASNGAYDKFLKAARTSSIGKYKKRSALEIAEAEEIAGDQLRKFGYMT